ncbi:retron Ec67 family RNA-directed DNA polymerase/endonuclease [Methylobacterium pseudosasicola]|uniref:RNA-directed DNA polymerase n=1 Tax=Methylobacterium pseudosasicola TaxID=582667 RepID=A0A1I4MN75_9HYPH|nr:retron Ec67 family RNA-directed DNA polymerase/endonuclease [Methylobacterium pseudosasicola]SFM04669.1 RNA-directed DNA polymerase [Methylobacterium pseudosasicola]
MTVSIVKDLKAAKSLDDLALLLGFSASGLSYILYKSNSAARYTEFQIPKRKGGTRTIKAPEPKLKLLQTRLAEILYNYLDGIEEKKKPFKAVSHGFAEGKSIITNAAVHKRRRYVLNIDLEDFFPTINFGRVRGVFIKDRRFEFDPKIATIIAQIACHDHSLPQGSPCSPVISNIVGRLLDVRLVRLAKEHKCTYSRYADDLTFSTNQSTFPAALAAPDPAAAGKWIVGNALDAEIVGTGFKINHGKTRMQFRDSRQTVTGLLVNEKVNIVPEYYRAARSMCSAFFQTGKYYHRVPAALVGGKAEDPMEDIVYDTPPVLEGILSHIYLIKNTVDRRTSAEKKKEENVTAIRKLYHHFLFYKNFVISVRPLIVTEGKTDPIYLKAAIERLPKFHPKLGAFKGGKFQTTVRFLNFTSTVRDVLQLGGGSGDLMHFIEKYFKILSKFKHAPLAAPVIVLIDNDDGAGKIFGKIQGLTKCPPISTLTTEPFYYITANLYMIKTPEIGKDKGMTCIETFFEDTVLKTVLGGKTLSLNKKHLEPGKYGKAIFAEKVIRPNKATIKFDAFEPLLDRITAVLDHHAAKAPPAA